MSRSITVREREIVNLMLMGWKVPQIAQELKIEHRTVRHHLNRLYIKFDIGNEWVKRVRLVYLWSQQEAACQLTYSS